MFIEQPETGLHPKRERLVMSMFKKLSEEYGYEEVQPAHDVDGDQWRVTKTSYLSTTDIGVSTILLRTHKHRIKSSEDASYPKQVREIFYNAL